MKRSAGVLLSVTSLPSKYGIGSFSRSAYDFIDFLSGAGQTYWQILPLGPTSYGPSGDSPYQSYSAFAGNPYMIDLDRLIEEGVLTQEECDAIDFGTDETDVDYDKLYAGRYVLLHKAYERSRIAENPEYQRFLQENGWWLWDYALFMAIKRFFGDVLWTQWPEDIRRRWGYAMDYYRTTLYFEVEFETYMQFKFFQQWGALKTYANSRGIQIIGDMPIYVSMDSADIWAHPELFQMDDDFTLSAVAGCPPDSFSATGQMWGNPLYRWDYHKETGYAWWVSRLWQSYRMYDAVRIDHFRGFDEYYAIPKNATALEGHWEKGPGMDLFNKLTADLGEKQVIAEDLGLITETVRKLVRDSGYPNMKVIQFAFAEDDFGAWNDYLPHNFGGNCVVYTGTHDNETLDGWFEDSTPEMKKLVRGYLCNEDTPDDKIWRSLRAVAMMSRADVCIVPIQDHIGLDNRSRMNQPATVGKNWRWRLAGKYLTAELQEDIRETTRRYGRMNWDGFRTAQENGKVMEIAPKTEAAEKVENAESVENTEKAEAAEQTAEA